MSINEIKGNILERNDTYVVIPVNCKGYPGKGLALEWAKMYPELVAGYKKNAADGLLRPGEYGLAKAANGITFVSG
jgi:hypothetical protein